MTTEPKAEETKNVTSTTESNAPVVEETTAKADEAVASPETPAEVTTSSEQKPERIPSDLRTGNRVRVHQKIKQGEKERIQIFEGVLISMNGQDPATKTITVRKIAEGNFGVERIWPIQSPVIEKIEIVDRPKVRRAKLYYLRGSLKKMKKLRERA